MHYHVKTTSLMGANTSRPILDHEQAAWLAEEQDAALWATGYADNVRVDILRCEQECGGTPLPQAPAVAA